jgi:hypothetical protein
MSGLGWVGLGWVGLGQPLEPGRSGVVLGVGRIGHVGIISGLCRPPSLLLECRCVYIEDYCSQETVVEGLLLEGAKWANGSLQLSDELRCSLPPCKLKWQLKGQRKVSSGGGSGRGSSGCSGCGGGGGSSSSSVRSSGESSRCQGSSGGSSSRCCNSSSSGSSIAAAVVLVILVVVPLCIMILLIVDTYYFRVWW